MEMPTNKLKALRGYAAGEHSGAQSAQIQAQIRGASYTLLSLNIVITHIYVPFSGAYIKVFCTYSDNTIDNRVTR